MSKTRNQYIPFEQGCDTVLLQLQKLMDKRVHGPAIQTTPVCLPQDCQTSFTWDSVKQPHPIPDIPTSARALFSLKQSPLFKIRGRNKGHIFSSCLLTSSKMSKQSSFVRFCYHESQSSDQDRSLQSLFVNVVIFPEHHFESKRVHFDSSL